MVALNCEKKLSNEKKKTKKLKFFKWIAFNGNALMDYEINKINNKFTLFWIKNLLSQNTQLKKLAYFSNEIKVFIQKFGRLFKFFLISTICYGANY